MNRWLLTHLPTWGIMLLMVIGAVLLALVMLRLVRRFLSDWSAGEQNEVATLSVEIIGAVYGFILAFIIVALWEGFSAADDNVAREATALSQVVRSAAAFPPEPRLRVVRVVGEYVHLVTDEEWALMREGESSDRAGAALGAVYSALQQYEPITETQKVF